MGRKSKTESSEAAGTAQPEKKTRNRRPSAEPSEYAAGGYVLYVGKKPFFYRDEAALRAAVEDLRKKAETSRKIPKITLGELGPVTISKKVVLEYDLSDTGGFASSVPPAAPVSPVSPVMADTACANVPAGSLVDLGQ